MVGDMGKEKLVKELMVPLSDYALVNENETVAEAIAYLRKRRKEFTHGKHMPRALLVLNSAGKVVGQLEYSDFIKALEPKYAHLGDLGTLARAGISNELVNSMMENLKFWESSLEDACRRIGGLKVNALARPIAESIDENETLQMAIHKVLLMQAMRIPVTRREEVVGVLRMADIFDEISTYIESRD